MGTIHRSCFMAGTTLGPQWGNGEMGRHRCFWPCGGRISRRRDVLQPLGAGPDRPGLAVVLLGETADHRGVASGACGPIVRLHHGGLPSNGEEGTSRPDRTLPTERWGAVALG